MWGHLLAQKIRPAPHLGRGHSPVGRLGSPLGKRRLPLPYKENPLPYKENSGLPTGEAMAAALGSAFAQAAAATPYSLNRRTTRQLAATGCARGGRWSARSRNRGLADTEPFGSILRLVGSQLGRWPLPSPPGGGHSPLGSEGRSPVGKGRSPVGKGRSLVGKGRSLVGKGRSLVGRSFVSPVGSRRLPVGKTAQSGENELPSGAKWGARFPSSLALSPLGSGLSPGGERGGSSG